MNRKGLGIALAAVSWGTVAAGCGEGHSRYPSPTVFFDGGTGGGGGSTGTDARSGDAGVAGPPVAGSGSMRLLSGLAELVGSGANSCTNQVGQTGDRWCAVAVLSTTLGNTALKVVNVTKALAGASITCTGTDPNCLSLTSDLYRDPDLDLSLHGFDGDTLIYYASLGATATQSSGFVGTVYAWRPGWQGGRALTSDTGVVCSGHPTAEVAYCFEHRDDSITTQTSYDLTAGRLPAAGGAPLPKVESLLIVTNTDAQGVRKFQAALSPDGTSIAWSARPAANGVETLKVQKLNDDSTRQTVASDVSRWLIAPDGARWYWLKSYNYDLTGAASGTLQMAAFPAGASPTTLATNVGEVRAAGDKGLLLRTQLTTGVGTLKVIQDRDDATAIKTLDSAVLRIFDVTPDGRATVYTKGGDITNAFNLFATTVTSAQPCVLQRDFMAAPVGTMLPNGAGVLWVRFDATTGDPQGMFTKMANCGSQQFASTIVQYAPVGDEGVVYADEGANGPNTVEGTLRYAQVNASGTLAPAPAKLQTRVTATYGVLVPALPAVVYTVNARDQAGDGLYVNGTLPFVGPAPAPDGGSAPGADAGTAPGADARADARTAD